MRCKRLGVILFCLIGYSIYKSAIDIPKQFDNFPYDHCNGTAITSYKFDSLLGAKKSRASIKVYKMEAQTEKNMRWF